VDTIQSNLNQIHTQLETAKANSPYNQNVQIIAVTKSVSVERTQEAVDASIYHLGENRPEGLMNKVEHINGDVVWHYIGSLQTRKVKQILPYIDYLHSLDRLSLADEIEKRAEKPLKCFVQVNVSGEESKHGLNAEEAVAFIEALKDYKNIIVVGLMTMAPFTEDEAVIRQTFKGLKRLQEKIKEIKYSHAPCTELSMGMSNDFEVAIEEGATFVRIGTALVGEC
jgi:PLP dependent protein